MYSDSKLTLASLKHTKAIQFLLSSGDSALRHPILIKYSLSKKNHPSHPDILFTPVVPAKKIKKAFERNLLKRRIKESVRNSLLNFSTEKESFKITDNQIHILYIYLDKEIKEFNTIDYAIRFLNKKYITKLMESGK
jgi:ribonuclease P protein component